MNKIWIITLLHKNASMDNQLDKINALKAAKTAVSTAVSIYNQNDIYKRNKVTF